MAGLVLNFDIKSSCPVLNFYPKELNDLKKMPARESKINGFLNTKIQENIDKYKGQFLKTRKFDFHKNATRGITRSRSERNNSVEKNRNFTPSVGAQYKNANIKTLKDRRVKSSRSHRSRFVLNRPLLNTYDGRK